VFDRLESIQLSRRSQSTPLRRPFRCLVSQSLNVRIPHAYPASMTPPALFICQESIEQLKWGNDSGVDMLNRCMAANMLREHYSIQRF
jgi:hypothetical protein